MKTTVFFLFLFMTTISAYTQTTNIFPSSGNVGIGTLTPDDELHIKKNLSEPVIFKVENEGNALNSHTVFVMKNSGVGNSRMQWVSSGIGTWYMGVDNTDETKLKFVWNDHELNNPSFAITKTGLVGIGTGNPQSQLSVGGTIEAEKVKVIVDVPDYVFEDDYDLFTLSDLEHFIKAHKHLPSVPSVRDAANDRGFVSLGELSAGTLENLETSILHLIEVNKKVEALEAEKDALVCQFLERLEVLEERIAQLEKENKELRRHGN